MQKNMSEAANEYEQERRSKREKLRELGMDPYGGREVDVVPLAVTKALFKSEMGHDGGPVVKAAGRVMFAKRFGKLSFMTLRDESGDLQVALDKKAVERTGFCCARIDRSWRSDHRRRFAGCDQDGGSDRLGKVAEICREVVASTTRQMGWIERCRNPLSAALCRPVGQSRGDEKR